MNQSRLTAGRRFWRSGALPAPAQPPRRRLQRPQRRRGHRLPLPRHLADRASSPRCRAASTTATARLLPRHLGLDDQVDQGRRRRRQRRDRRLRRLQGRASARISAYDVGVLHYQYPQQRARRPQPEHHRGLRRADLRPGDAEVLARGHRHSSAVRRQQGQLLPRRSAPPSTSATAGVDARSPHIGLTRSSRSPRSTAGVVPYTDYSLGARKDFERLRAQRGLVGTDADKSFYASPATARTLGNGPASSSACKYSF